MQIWMQSYTSGCLLRSVLSKQMKGVMPEAKSVAVLETTSNTVCDNDAPCIFFEILSDEGLFMITDDAVVTFVRAGTFELPGTGYGAIGARERELVKEWAQVTLAVRRRPSWPCRMLTLSGLAERIEHGLRQRPLRVVFTYFLHVISIVITCYQSHFFMHVTIKPSSTQPPVTDAACIMITEDACCLHFVQIIRPVGLFINWAAVGC